MSNVLFTRDTLTNIEDSSLHPITDGQLLFDTSGSGKMYMDVETQRLEMGGAITVDSQLNSTSTNPIQNKAVGGVMLSTLDEVNATTSKGFITDALATRALAQKIGTTDISSIGDGTCTGAISVLNTKNTGKVLWVNDNPSSSFSVQTVTLNSNDYDVLDIYYRDSASSTTTILCVSAMKGYNADLMRTGGTHHTETIIVRIMEYVNDTTLKFQACYSSGSGNTPVNSINVPIKIVGRKSI